MKPRTNGRRLYPFARLTNYPNCGWPRFRLLVACSIATDLLTIIQEKRPIDSLKINETQSFEVMKSCFTQKFFDSLSSKTENES